MQDKDLASKLGSHALQKSIRKVLKQKLGARILATQSGSPLGAQQRYI